MGPFLCCMTDYECIKTCSPWKIGFPSKLAHRTFPQQPKQRIACPTIQHCLSGSVKSQPTLRTKVRSLPRIQKMIRLKNGMSTNTRSKSTFKDNTVKTSKIVQICNFTFLDLSSNQKLTSGGSRSEGLLCKPAWWLG